MAKTDGRGWWFNYRGDAVHPDLIKADEKLKDELVEKILARAIEERERIAQFDKWVDESAGSFMSLLMDVYGIDAKRQTKKGNLTLENYSKTAKLEIRAQDSVTFDEKLQIAKMKVDEYLEDITSNSTPEIRTLITRAFEVDKKGKIDAKRIFDLKNYDIPDLRWKEAIAIIDDSKQITHTTTYKRFYIRDSVDKPYKFVAIDIASVANVQEMDNGAERSSAFKI
ncbi:MAG: DUF3164 family protein [Campylobacteraceae bacterium]|jgi:hypothetical protein|nr:DUF3164 family protein [Campylobacteraceae bacterium]